MEISAEETLFIVYREELKALINKWNAIFETVGYLNVPTSVTNSSLCLEDALESVNYVIPCEQQESEG